MTIHIDESTGVEGTAQIPFDRRVTLAFDGHGGLIVDPPVVLIDDYLPAHVVARQDANGRISLQRSPAPRSGSGMVLPCLGLEQAILGDLVRRGY